MLHGDAGRGFEEFGGKVLEGAVAGRAIGHGIRLFLGATDQFGDRLDFCSGTRDECKGIGSDQADGLKCAGLRRFWVERRADRKAADFAEHDGRAVRGCRGRELIGDGAACARTIFDDDRLADFLRHFLRDDPGDGVGAATGGLPNHQPDWLADQLCLGNRCDTQQRHGGRDQRQNRKLA